MTFQYQKLGLHDIPLIQQMGRATYEPYYKEVWNPGGLDWYMEKCFGTAILLRELPDPNIEYLIPYDETGKPVGMLKLVLQEPTPDGTISNALYLEKIYLLPDFFGKGIGQLLMSFVCEKAAMLEREAVWLTVMKSGPVKAYERAGFRHIGEVSYDFELLKAPQRLGLVMLKAC